MIVIGKIPLAFLLYIKVLKHLAHKAEIYWLCQTGKHHMQQKYVECEVPSSTHKDKKQKTLKL